MYKVTHADRNGLPLDDRKLLLSMTLGLNRDPLTRKGMIWVKDRLELDGATLGRHISVSFELLLVVSFL